MSLTDHDIKRIGEIVDQKIEPMRAEISDMKSEIADMKSLNALQADSARARADYGVGRSLSYGLDFYAKPPGHGFVEPRRAWISRSDYDTD